MPKRNGHNALRLTPSETKDNAALAGLTELPRLSHSDHAPWTKTSMLSWLFNNSFLATTTLKLWDAEELLLEMPTDISKEKVLLKTLATHTPPERPVLTEPATTLVLMLKEREPGTNSTAKLDQSKWSPLTEERTTNTSEWCSKRKDPCISHSRSPHPSCNTSPESSEDNLERESSEDTLLNLSDMELTLKAHTGSALTHGDHHGETKDTSKLKLTHHMLDTPSDTVTQRLNLLSRNSSPD